MDNEDNRPHIRYGDIKYTKGYEIRLFIKTIVKLLVGLLFTIVVSGTVYIYINQPVLVDGGDYITAETTHRMYKKGEDIVFIETENFNMFTPLIRTFNTNKTYNARIIAGPYGEIKEIDNEQIVIHGDEVENVNLEEREDPFLNEEYVIRQLGSNGETINSQLDEIVTKEEILGLIK